MDGNGTGLDVSRRNIMIAAGTMAALGALPGNARAAASLPTMPSSRFALRNFSNAQVQSELKSSNWNGVRAELVRRFSYLSAFSTPLSVDSIVYEEVNRAGSAIPPYDPYQLEQLAASASDLLDRCLSNRRSMYDLEEQAIRSALEYKLFKDQRQPQRDIELSETIEVQKTWDLQGQKNAAAAFSKSFDNLDAGFAAVATASAQSTAEAISGEKTRKKNVGMKWDALDEFENALEARHSMPGCSMNYSERYGRLEELLRQDIRVAYNKLRCIEKGMNQVFGLSLSLPPPQQYGYLDAMVMFLRQALEAVGIATQNEVEFDHIVSLHQNRASKPDGSAPSQFFNDTQWGTMVGANGNGVLQFKLDTEFPPAIKTLRVRGVGLAILFTDSSGDILNSVEHLRSVPAVICPPQVTDLFSPGSLKNRPPVIVGAATWFDPSQPKVVAASAVGNIDPRAGTWQVQLSPGIMTTGIGATGRANAITDVKLVLRLAGTVDASAFPWSTPVW